MLRSSFFGVRTQGSCLGSNASSLCDLEPWDPAGLVTPFTAQVGWQSVPHSEACWGTAWSNVGKAHGWQDSCPATLELPGALRVLKPTLSWVPQPFRYPVLCFSDPLVKIMVPSSPLLGHSDFSLDSGYGWTRHEASVSPSSVWSSWGARFSTCHVKSPGSIPWYSTNANWIE